ncbi:metallophosphoesterase [Pseudopedobacter beijingensis]|uniref:Metallophosphoesterase n=1 Tax=Pseudopedobacter beijingensis TaxID=1207056 RepID=A0ABW4IIU6_9SPHI
MLTQFTAVFSQRAVFAANEQEWTSNNIPDSVKILRSIYLIGDAGKLDENNASPTLTALKKKLLINSNKQDILIFLGDNIYPKGMPDQNSRQRKEKEAVMDFQIQIQEKFKGKIFFIPGNHDWKQGLKSIDLQRDYINDHLNNGAFLPEPQTYFTQLEIDNTMLLLFLDSESLISKEKVDTVTSELQKTFKQYKHHHILIAQHHPLYSNGPHGGYFTLKDHIFPLTAIYKNLYIPLPLLGSFYPILRQQGLSTQDLNNPKYTGFAKTLINEIKQYQNIVVTSGHEHALQLLKKGKINQVVSGSSIYTSKIFPSKNILFGIGANGYARLNYYENGQCWVEFYTVTKETNKAELVYRKALYALPTNNVDLKIEKAFNYADSTKIIAVGKKYKASKSKAKFLGKHYRKSWVTPVEVPFLDLTRAQGGLKPLNRSENTLTLQNEKGKNFRFSIINNNPYDLLPSGFDATIVKELMDDQASTSYPFGSIIVDYLSKKAKIDSLDSHVFYLPPSKILGEYLSDFGGKVGILQHEIDSTKLLSTHQLYTELESSQENVVNQQLFLKHRLFDLLIGDFNRGEDEWLWEAEKQGKKTIYHPVNKYRKQFFTKIDGYIPLALKNLAPEIRHFGNKIKKPKNLSIMARNLDRNLLNQLSEEIWIATADSLKNLLTDDIIRQAVTNVPKNSYDIDGEELIQKLIIRKNSLTQVARKYYRILSRNVRVIGTKNDDIFLAFRTPKGTELNLIDTQKETKSFNRIFLNKETKSLTLYGLDGNDSLFINGNTKSRPIKIRFVGGNGNDYLENSSNQKRVLFYDDDKTRSPNNKNSKLIFNNQPWINDFNRNDFIYNKVGFSPNAMIYNMRDFASAGFTHNIKLHGFRKYPYAFAQTVSVLLAPVSGALEVKYLTSFYSLFSYNYDLILAGRYMGPAYDFNFYGLGNDTENTGNMKYYQIRSKTAFFNTYFQKRVNNHISIGIGPGFEYFNILKQDSLHYLNSSVQRSPSYDWFLKLDSYFNFDYSDDNLSPKNGWIWSNGISYFKSWQNQANHVNIKSDFRAYLTPLEQLPVTLAIRLGGAKNFGNYNFYHANSLGSISYLRGYRSERFSGDAALYSNAELRSKLTKLRSRLIAGDMGFYSFYDVGRVFYQKSENNTWHKAYGPGIWVNLFDNLILTLGYGISKDDKVFSFDTKFRF